MGEAPTIRWCAGGWQERISQVEKQWGSDESEQQQLGSSSSWEQQQLGRRGRGAEDDKQLKLFYYRRFWGSPPCGVILGT